MALFKDFGDMPRVNMKITVIWDVTCSWRICINVSENLAAFILKVEVPEERGSTLLRNFHIHLLDPWI
jgi:hypothetical protein